jgi:hypothetical protein
MHPLLQHLFGITAAWKFGRKNYKRLRAFREMQGIFWRRSKLSKGGPVVHRLEFTRITTVCYTCCSKISFLFKGGKMNPRKTKITTQKGNDIKGKYVGLSRMEVQYNKMLADFLDGLWDTNPDLAAAVMPPVEASEENKNVAQPT